jgi:hypothetical protein
MIRVLLTLGLVIFACHLTVVFGGPVLENRMLEGKMRDVAEDRALRPDREIRDEVMEFIREKGIPLTEEQVVFQKADRGYRIAARYHVTAKFLFLEHAYDFYPASEDRARLRRLPSTAPAKRSGTSAKRR